MSSRRSARRLILPTLALLLALLPAVADAGSATPPSRITIGVLALPTTLDPLLDPLGPTADVAAGIFDSLLSADTHNALQPDLATGYSTDARGLRYEFTLDPRAHWQDGVPVTA